MEAIQDSHARIRSRGCQLDTSTLSKEDGNEQTQFNHDKVDGDASPRTGREGLEFILHQRLALRRREPASVIKSCPRYTSVGSNMRPGSRLTSPHHPMPPGCGAERRYA